MMTRFTGVVPAMITPFTENGNIDFEALEKHASWLYEEGVSGLCACGSTGEHEALSFEEKIRVYRATALVSKKYKGYTVACLGGGATWEACRLAQEAEKAECDVLLVLPPYYYNFSSEEIMDYFKEISKSTSLEIMIYHNPGKTNVRITPQMVAELTNYCPNITLIKDSSADIRNVMEIIRCTEGKVSYFNGIDSIALESLYVGANALFSGCGGNVIPGSMVTLYNLVQEKKYEEALQHFKKIHSLLTLLDKGRLAACVKAAVEMVSGQKVGFPRRPYFPVTNEEKANIQIALVEIGILHSRNGELQERL